MINYYPPTFDTASIVRRYPELEMVNEEEQARLEDVEIKKKRGKGAPKKARSAGMSICFQRHKYTDVVVLQGESRRAGKKR